MQQVVKVGELCAPTTLQRLPSRVSRQAFAQTSLATDVLLGLAINSTFGPAQIACAPVGGGAWGGHGVSNQLMIGRRRHRRGGVDVRYKMDGGIEWVG